MDGNGENTTHFSCNDLEANPTETSLFDPNDEHSYRIHVTAEYLATLAEKQRRVWVNVRKSSMHGASGNSIEHILRYFGANHASWLRSFWAFCAFFHVIFWFSEFKRSEKNMQTNTRGRLPFTSITVFAWISKLNFVRGNDLTTGYC